MDYTQAVVDLCAGGAGAAAAMKPLMLHTVLFCPVVRWVCQELCTCGVERFFVVCDENWRKDAADALKEIDNVSFFTTLHDALDAAQGGDTVVVPEAVVPVIGEHPRAVYAADAALLRTRLAGGLTLADCPADAPAVRPAGSVTAAFLPVPDAAALQEAMPLCRDLLLRRLALAGVTVMDPANTYVDPRSTVGEGTVLLPGTILRGCTVIGRDCEIGPNSMIRDCTIGDDTTINASQLNESTIGSHTTVGPFAYVRPDCKVGDHCRIGDFVELKNSVLGDGTKVSHLTYVGDSDVGRRVNFGCGTVTTNYNGLHKYRCTVGDDVFLGCNTNLIAPVTVGDGAYTAAGSTVDRDVPAGALAIARARQENKPGWADRFFKEKK